MKVRLKTNLIIVTAESPEELQNVAAWGREVDGHVFELKHQDEQTFRLTGLGLRAEACREPINVTSRSLDPGIQLISNFAHTPFELDGQEYGSVESFWQGLKFPEKARRKEIAPLHGGAARRAGVGAPESDRIEYPGQSVRVGTFEHWQLMLLACRAKFSQHDDAKQALLGTWERPLVHITRRDSKTTPGVVMADIWMRVRRGLFNQIVTKEETDDQEEDAEGD